MFMYEVRRRIDFMPGKILYYFALLPNTIPVLFSPEMAQAAIAE